MLSLSRKTDESIKIGADITITVVRLAGNRVVLGIDAPKSVRVWRSEIVEAWDASKGKQT